MKTELIEIFQSIRAYLQPYATRGYAVDIDSEQEYVLLSEKNILTDKGKITERFFAGVYINEAEVEIKLNAADIQSEQKEWKRLNEDVIAISLSSLDKKQLMEIENLIEIIHTRFKEKEWI
ncbi:hypothetical protein [Pedobacter sp. MW01-1-1]|uniref:hypothetical protein n=1 Tax=Pedobacter sp. MW01-1-1 TaxID=3383027 RepID=UPI003FEED2AA